MSTDPSPPGLLAGAFSSRENVAVSSPHWVPKLEWSSDKRPGGKKWPFFKAEEMGGEGVQRAGTPGFDWQSERWLCRRDQQSLIINTAVLTNGLHPGTRGHSSGVTWAAWAAGLGPRAERGLLRMRGWPAFRERPRLLRFSWRRRLGRGRGKEWSLSTRQMPSGPEPAVCNPQGAHYIEKSAHIQSVQILHMHKGAP